MADHRRTRTRGAVSNRRRARGAVSSTRRAWWPVHAIPCTLHACSDFALCMQALRANVRSWRPARADMTEKEGTGGRQTRHCTSKSSMNSFAAACSVPARPSALSASRSRIAVTCQCVASVGVAPVGVAPQVGRQAARAQRSGCRITTTTSKPSTHHTRPAAMAIEGGRGRVTFARRSPQ